MWARQTICFTVIGYFNEKGGSSFCITAVIGFLGDALVTTEGRVAMNYTNTKFGSGKK